jgi:hypothetical protein
MGYSANQKIQIGAEGTPGSAVPATTIWRGKGSLEDARTMILTPEQLGYTVPSARIATSFLQGKLAMPATDATFHQLPYILEAGILKCTPTPDSGTADIYVYPMGHTTVNTIRTYTIESGDNTAVEEMEYAFVESFAISGKYGELLQMSANWIGRQVTTSAFTGSLTVPTVEEIIGGKGTLYIDEPSGTLGTTPITAGAILDFNLAVNTGRFPRATVDSGTAYFLKDTYDREKMSAKLSLTWVHNSDATTEKGHWKTGTARQIRLKFVGSAIATPGTYSYHTLYIDLVGIYTKFSALDQDNGDSIIKAEFEAGFDPTANITPLSFTVVVDDYAALP